jgi:hypothetical protein
MVGSGTTRRLYASSTAFLGLTAMRDRAVLEAV